MIQMEDSLLIKTDEDSPCIGVLVELSLTDNYDKRLLRNLKRRAMYHGYSLMKQVLVDYIKGFKYSSNYKPDNVLSIKFNCGNSVTYKAFNDIPNEDVPCPCGNPKHWFIQYRDLRNFVKEGKGGI